MNKVKCIIIEDEKPAQEVLISLISRMKSLDLKATFDEALSALDYLKTHEVDLLFLDIQIPSLNGINFMKVLKNPPAVIITTAFSEYALEAFDLNVLDYLKKPISFERFVKAIGKLSIPQEVNYIYQPGHTNDVSDEIQFAFFNVNKTKVKVLFDDILFVESMREYVYIHTDKKKVITKIGIGEMEHILGKNFLRIHRSYLVHKNKVTAYSAEELYIEEQSLPIGGNYKKLVEITFEGQVIS